MKKLLNLSVAALITANVPVFATSSHLPATQVEIKNCSILQQGAKVYLEVKHQGWNKYPNTQGYTYNLDLKVNVNDNNYGNIYKLKDLGVEDSTYDKTKVLLGSYVSGTIESITFQTNSGTPVGMINSSSCDNIQY